MNAVVTAETVPSKSITPLSWSQGMTGLNPHTGEWFVASRTERMTVAGFPMDVVWARSLMQTHSNSFYVVAKNSKEMAALRLLTPDEAHQGFADAFAALGSRKRFRTIRAVEYKALIADLRQTIQHPNPVDTARAWLRATHYLSVTQENGSGSIDLLQVRDDIYSVFSGLMRAVYGSTADAQLNKMMEAFAPAPPKETGKKTKGKGKKAAAEEALPAPDADAESDVPVEADTAPVEATAAENADDAQDAAVAVKVPFILTRADVVIGAAKKTKASVQKPSDDTPPPVRNVPPAGNAPTEDDLAFARAQFPDNVMVQRAAATFTRGAFMALVNHLTPPDKRRALADLTEALGVDIDRTRAYLTEARSFVARVNEETTQAATARRTTGIGPDKKGPNTTKTQTSAKRAMNAAAAGAVIDSIDLGHGLIIELREGKNHPVSVRGHDIRTSKRVFILAQVLNEKPGDTVPYLRLYSAMGGKQADVAYGLSELQSILNNPALAKVPRPTMTRIKGQGVTLIPAAAPATPAPAGKPDIKSAQPAAPAPTNGVVDSIDLGDGVIIDHYDRKQRANIVRGRDKTIGNNVYKILKVLTAPGTLNTPVPYARVKAAFNSASAGVLASQGLTELEGFLSGSTFKADKRPKLERGRIVKLTLAQ